MGSRSAAMLASFCSRPATLTRSAVTENTTATAIKTAARIDTSSREFSEHQTLEIVGLGHADEHGMIARLRAFLDERHGGARVYRRVRHDGDERRLVDVVRAAARDEMTARRQDPQRPEIDLLVAGDCPIHGGAVLREGRRVEHDRVEALAASLELPQLVKDIDLARLDVGQLV